MKWLFAVAAVLALGLYFLRSENAPSPIVTAEPRTGAVPQAAPVTAVTIPKLTVAVSPPKLEPLKISGETQRRLAEVTRLDRKAFMSEEEKTFRKSALNDDAFLKEIAATLTSRSLDVDTKRSQYQAIDALLEAKTPAAEELLRSVVADGSVEDDKLAKDVRANLAGIKAEILYKWQTTEPVEELLPGPVSRKLWSNVRDQQSRIDNESQTIKH